MSAINPWRSCPTRERAQKCGQIFGAVSAKMGNGVWTVEIIPAEVEPPPRNPAGASGIRVRLGDRPVTNWGDETNLIVAFNEQALLGRHRLNALAADAVVLIEESWASVVTSFLNAFVLPYGRAPPSAPPS